MSTDSKVTAIEYKYNVMAIESEHCKDLFYLYDKDKKGIGILTFPDGSPTYVLLNKRQAQSLFEELGSVINEIFEV